MREGVRLFAGTQAGSMVWRSGRLCSKSSDGAESWTRITDSLADDLDSMIWALVDHPKKTARSLPVFAMWCAVMPADPEVPVIS
jgi:hypothetical protein